MGHPEKPLSDVGRSDGDGFPAGLIATHKPSFGFLPRPRSTQIGTPNGVSKSLQRSTYSGVPDPAISARNLLPKDDWRAAVADETPELGPDMTVVGVPGVLAFDADEHSSPSRARDRTRSTASGASLLAAGCRERRARAGAGPDGLGGIPASETEGEIPASNSAEEMHPIESHKLACLNIDDRPFVHGAGRDQSGVAEVAEPLRGVGVELVVVGGHGNPHALCCCVPNLQQG